MSRDWFLCEANVFSYNGRHWFDKEKKAYFMEYRGMVFIYNADRELWEYYEDGIHDGI